ncbi:hypothetical protein HPB51_027631 [Rhipicephalus microplus]|uniref:Regulatory protein zeste n=1 Tax=Rhipicephalus microplus TaxID=6941 RepID=A0A9J6CZR1_RHIMP|nr:hypothetical protein HPB51_027631 [Rhipicephalus microplus]
MSFNDDGGVARDGRKTTATRFVFTREERELLVNLVTRHKAVIENKRTDALTKRAKDSAWEKADERIQQPTRHSSRYGGTAACPFPSATSRQQEAD